MKHILIVDDEVGSRESLKAIFNQNFRVSTAQNAHDARKLLSDKPIDLMLLDFMMPDEDGLSFLKETQSTYPNMPVIMVSASTAVRPVVEAIRSGALDFVTKPFDVNEVRLIVERTLERSTMRRQIEVLKGEVSREYPVHGIVGKSASFQKVVDATQQAAETDATVLIHGESGTGKELIARLLHSSSARRDEPFVAVHCGALPETLMESELFGHEKGAFTNADKRKAGRFELAGNGTLFFDEVSEMSLTTQVKLLRVLQEREYMRIGGTQIIRTNARICAATNKDLVKEMQEKRFREDLFYRLNVVPLQIPPLRERRDDIPLLARHFLGFFRQSMNAATRDFSPDAVQRLAEYNWPGNVRELRNIIERLVVLNRQREIITPDCLPDEFKRGDRSFVAMPKNLEPELVPAIEDHDSGNGNGNGVTHGSLEDSVNAYERELVMKALQQANGVQTRAAEILGTTRRILKYRMVKLNIAEVEEGVR